MAKLIKKAEVKQFKFNVGDKVKFYSHWFDGRISGFDEYSGTVVKVNKVTIDVMVESGDIWRVESHELHKL